MYHPLHRVLLLRQLHDCVERVQGKEKLEEAKERDSSSVLCSLTSAPQFQEAVQEEGETGCGEIYQGGEKFHQNRECHFQIGEKPQGGEQSPESQGFCRGNRKASGMSSRIE